MRVLFSHLCEKAFLSQNGNLNMIGIFENIMAEHFPVIFPQLCLVTALKGEPGTNHQQTITIINITTAQALINPITINLSLAAASSPTAPNKPQHLRIIGDINNLSIPEPGEYRVDIHLDGSLSYSIPFSVIHAQKPIPMDR